MSDLFENHIVGFLMRRLISSLISGCGHCKKAKPEFMAAAAQFKDDTKVMNNFALSLSIW